MEPLRVLACDDGVVRKLGSGHTLLTCVSWEEGVGVTGLAFLPVTVDGLDGTSAAVFMARHLAYPRGVDLVLLDSLTLAGFNVVSPASLHEATGAPVAVVYTYKPSLERLARGLEAARLPYASVRLRVLSLVERARRVETPRGPLYLVEWPPGADTLPAIVKSQVYDRRPAPLRAAHYISSALSRLLTEGS